jgi:probable HAF family extracellular repeat protein
MMNFMSKLLCLASLGLAAQCSSSLAADWVITPLGSEASPTADFASSAVAINNLGQIIGQSSFDTGTTPRPVLWSAGQQTDLGIQTGGQALSINNSGQIVGWLHSSTNAHPFIWSNGTLKELPLLPGGLAARAESINDAGQVVGTANYPWNDSSFLDWSAVLWADTTITPLVSYDAVAINDLGQMLLVDSNPGSLPNVVVNGELVPISTGGDPDVFGSIEALALNDQTQVVGSFSADLMRQTPWQAFVWDNGVFTVLPGFPLAEDTCAKAINHPGQIVGYSFNGIANQRAVLWENGEMTDLSLLPEALANGWILTEATCINDWGQIVGNGYLNGLMRGFLLSPQPRLLVSRDGDTLILDWHNPGYTLQSTAGIDHAWAPVASPSTPPPVRIPMSSAQTFFRLVKVQ